MGLFKKKDRKRGGDEGFASMPLLGDASGSPYYAKSPVYNGDPTTLDPAERPEFIDDGGHAGAYRTEAADDVESPS